MLGLLPQIWIGSSGVERYLEAVGVGGAIPSQSTNGELMTVAVRQSHKLE